jgi:gamma-glutamylcyclotransferase (GGCT)/AIG2-like uncharacterized protein YtfP
MAQVFCYGMLKNPLVWLMVTRTWPRITSTATLEGFKLVRSGSKAVGDTLCVSPGDRVSGILRPATGCWERLDAFEKRYTRMPATLHTPGGLQDAYLYLRSLPQ